jgi:4-amino-4-deoxy-L-arabinose transferase-like glycosyltransferase
MATRVRRWTVRILVLMVALTVRLHGLDWDDGIGAHPDERFIIGAAERLRASGHLNVFEVAPGYAYGHLPLYMLAAVMGDSGADPLLVGRVLAALFDTGTVALAFVLGHRVCGWKGEVLPAALLTLTVLHVQQAHFFTVDVVVAFFALGAVLAASRLSLRGRARDAWLTGLLTGLALGCKFSVILLAIPIGAACTTISAKGKRCWVRGLQAGGAALLAFALTNHQALLSLPVFLGNVSRETAIGRGALHVAYTVQFHGTWPYVYPVVQQVLWGMGIPLGVFAFGGLLWATASTVRRSAPKAEWVVLMWALPYFAFTGALYAKFPRYLLPVAPVLIAYGARLILSIPISQLRRTVVAACLGATLLHCLVFLTLFRVPHPWQTASEWFYANVPSGAVVAVEQWDHPLPVGGTDSYELRELPVFEDDSGIAGAEKWVAMDAVLAEADYVVLASRRGYGALARWPERYPLTARYYQNLFEGRLGFEPVACFRRDPRLGPIELVDDPTRSLPFSLPDICLSQAPIPIRLRLDESFVVYDHPQVLVFRRVDRID